VKFTPSDSDGDGMRDDLDCAPSDMMAFATPGEVRDLKYESKTLLSWTTEAGRSGPGTSYDVVRGPLSPSGLPVQPGSTGSCAYDGLFVTYHSDTTPLPAGTGAFILVRAVNACGTGGYGFATSGIERTTGVCP